jgi:hypothetical protein
LLPKSMHANLPYALTPLQDGRNFDQLGRQAAVGN